MDILQDEGRWLIPIPMLLGYILHKYLTKKNGRPAREDDCRGGDNSLLPGSALLVARHAPALSLCSTVHDITIIGP